MCLSFQKKKKWIYHLFIAMYLPSFIFQSLVQHNKNFTMVFFYPSGWKLTPTGVNEDWLQYTHSTWQTPARLRPRILLPHTGDYTTHISTHNSTSEGTPYHSKIESYTAPLKTDAKLHLSGPPFHSTTSMFITATAHSPVLPHIEASTNAAFVLLTSCHTPRS